MAEHKHHAVCPLCTRVVSKDGESAAEDVVESHNRTRHDGDPVAEVVGPHKEDLNEFVDRLRDEFAGEVHREMIRHIVKTDPWNVR